jgi:predicted HTH transcriptional regulator
MDLKELEALREGWDFEAKKAAGRGGLGEVPVSFWETYSAMANSQGGRVVLGARERKDHSLQVVGLAEPERVEKELWDGLQDPHKVSANILGRDDVTLEYMAGVTVMVINIPRARREQRPVYVKGDLWGGTFLRVHEGDRKAGKERVRRMVADAAYEVRDDRVLGKFGVDDLDAESLRTYRQMFRGTNPDHPWVELKDGEFLRQLGAWRRDRSSGNEGLTAAGLLLLGRYEAICEVFPHYFIDYQERRAEAETIEWLDRVYADGTWSGNLFGFYRRVVRKLVADLPVPFRLGRDLYRRDDTHVHEALREALVNTLIHADYEGRLSVEVIKRPDRFDFRNPGSLRLPVELIRAGGRSDCRNRTLQEMFLRIGLGERAGSGFSRIQRAWREQHWAAPSLVEDAGLDEVRLRLGMVSLLGEEVVEELDRRFPRFRELDEVARLALGTAMSEGQVTNRRMQEITDRHPRYLTFLLRDLVDQGFLEPHGVRGGAWYTAAGAPVIRQAELGSEEGSPMGSSVLSGESSVHSGESSIHSVVVERVASSARCSTSQVRAAILLLCETESRTVAQLARLLSRSPHTLRKDYLRPMVGEGFLALEYPERPNHPRQAYRAKTREPS